MQKVLQGLLLRLKNKKKYMRAVIQRVKEARVISGGDEVGRIDKGLLILLAIKSDDTKESIKKMADKIEQLRVFDDKSGKMNLSLKDVDGSLLVISQFTLYGDCKKGSRPGFINSAKPEKAKLYYEKVVSLLREKGIHVETGIFGEMMNVFLINNGPVTLIYDT